MKERKFHIENPSSELIDFLRNLKAKKEAKKDSLLKVKDLLFQND